MFKLARPNSAGSNINLSIQQHYLKQTTGFAKHTENPKNRCLLVFFFPFHEPQSSNKTVELKIKKNIQYAIAFPSLSKKEKKRNRQQREKLSDSQNPSNDQMSESERLMFQYLLFKQVP